MTRAPFAATCIILTTALGSCARFAPQDATRTHVSLDYEATGDAFGLRAFVYGKRTVLELPGGPQLLSIRDENGVPVEYQREGRYYRFSQQLGQFTVWLNMRAILFTATAAAKLPAAPATAISAPTIAVPDAAYALGSVDLQGEASARLEQAPLSDDETKALLQLSVQQLLELRKALRHATPAETKVLKVRLDRVEMLMVNAATAIVRVQFDTEKTAYKPSEQVARVLVPAAKAAERVNVRGRTDSRSPGLADRGIALARALSARRFLVDRGVGAEKIKVFALPAGDFTASASTEEGRAMNRRVEIELINRRYAALSEHVVTLFQTSQ